jgi:hypothetical protein
MFIICVRKQSDTFVFSQENQTKVVYVFGILKHFATTSCIK